MKIKCCSYLGLSGTLSASCKTKIPPKTLLEAYRVMELNRRIDERMLILNRQGHVSFVLPSIGEEACSVGSASALKTSDWIFPQYREHGALFWRGYDVQEYIHQMFCNGKDPIKGRQMANHFGSKELNVVTVSSTLGTQLTHAVGAAYAMQIQGEKNVAIAYFGEGTSSKGDFHVAMNFAAVYKAPVIFFCRNNGYAISTPTCDQFATESIATRGPSYGVETFQVDGNDIFAVHETVAKARNHCIKQKGPVLIEAMSYRIGPHSTSDDPSVYRDDEEVNYWKKRCPILRLRRYLEKKKLWDKKKQEKMEAKIKEEIEAAIEEAKNAPAPALETLAEDVYFEIPETLKTQVREVQTLFEQENH